MPVADFVLARPGHRSRWARPEVPFCVPTGGQFGGIMVARSGRLSVYPLTNRARWNCFCQPEAVQKPTAAGLVSVMTACRRTAPKA